MEKKKSVTLPLTLKQPSRRLNTTSKRCFFNYLALQTTGFKKVQKLPVILKGIKLKMIRYFSIGLMLLNWL